MCGPVYSTARPGPLSQSKGVGLGGRFGLHRWGASEVLKADLAERQSRVFSFHDMEQRFWAGHAYLGDLKQWAIDGQEMALVEARSYTL